MISTAHSVASPQAVHRVTRRGASPLVREQARLHRHFVEVLAELRARDVSHLTPAQRTRRRRLVAELVRYARAGRFPRNLEFPGRRVPIFVDAFGTRCAMAHLIESTGHGALVAGVAAARNYARVRELAADAALQAWLAEFGLTVAEAGRIQPEYCFLTKSEVCFCNEQDGATTVIEATVVTRTGDGSMEVTIDAIHGQADGVMVGQQVVAHGAGEPGEHILAQLPGYISGEYAGARVVAADGTVGVDCDLDVPPLAMDDAIAAMLAPSGSCADVLKRVDEEWGASQCDGDGAGGCSCTADAGTPWVGGALLMAAVLLRRGRRRRPRG